jgi:hypothetical protein
MLDWPRGRRRKRGATVETVIGLSITSTSVGWVLVDGSAADGATLDHDAFDVDADTGTSQHAVAVRGAQAIAAATGHEVRSIGVTWSDDVETTATRLLESLRAAGYDNLVEVPLPSAAQAWAQGIGGDLGYEKTAVCVIEPATVTVLAVETGDGAVHTAVTHARESASVDGLSQWLTEAFDRDGRQPDSLLLVGSRSDREELTESLDEVLQMPVTGTDEAQLVLARGAALALAKGAAQSNVPAGETPGDDKRPHGKSWPASQTRMLTASLASVVVIGLALFAVIPRLAVEEASRPAENPTGAVTSAAPATA